MPRLQAAEPVVLVTIKPLAWVVQSLAPATADVQILLADGQSPHDYQLKPADVMRINSSALTVWIGPGLEPWLMQITGRLAQEKVLALLPDSVDDDEEEHQHPENGLSVANVNRDPHIWLDPLAMRDVAPSIAARLQTLYPAQASDIGARLVQFQQRMTRVDADMSTKFAPVSTRGFVVYHDGYSRLVKRYGLQQRAAVWHHESIPAGARERASLLALFNGGDVACLFYEPEHGRDVVNDWLGSAAKQVKMVELDPLGNNIKPAADAYEVFLRTVSGQMADCLR